MALNGIIGGGTKHRVKRNRRRTVKAAATYGAAYRKYNRMYGGAVDPAPVPVPPPPEEPGMWDKIKNFVTPNKDDDENEEKKKPAEEPGLFEKANAKVQETVNETVETAKTVANTAENALNETKKRVTDAAGAIKETASAVGTTLETSGALVKNQIGSAIDTIDAADKDAAENGNEEEATKPVVEEENPLAPETSGDMVEMTDDKRRIKELEERIRKMTSGTIAKAIEAAEQATGSVEDALKALQLAFIASKTVIAAGKAALVANSGNDEEAVLSQGADVDSETEPESTPVTEPVVSNDQDQAQSQSPTNDEGDDATDSSSASSDEVEDGGQAGLDDDEVPANSEASVSSAADTNAAAAAANSEPVIKAGSDDIPPETAEEPRQLQLDTASKAAAALNSETALNGETEKKMGGKKHKHKTKNSAVVHNHTRRAN